MLQKDAGVTPAITQYRVIISVTEVEMSTRKISLTHSATAALQIIGLCLEKMFPVKVWWGSVDIKFPEEKGYPGPNDPGDWMSTRHVSASLMCNSPDASGWMSLDFEVDMVEVAGNCRMWGPSLGSWRAQQAAIIEGNGDRKWTFEFNIDSGEITLYWEGKK